MYSALENSIRRYVDVRLALTLTCNQTVVIYKGHFDDVYVTRKLQVV